MDYLYELLALFLRIRKRGVGANGAAAGASLVLVKRQARQLSRAGTLCPRCNALPSPYPPGCLDPGWNLATASTAAVPGWFSSAHPPLPHTHAPHHIVHAILPVEN